MNSFRTISNLLVLIANCLVRGHTPTEGDDHNSFVFRHNYPNTIGTLPANDVTHEPELIETHLYDGATTQRQMLTAPIRNRKFSFANHTKAAYDLHMKLFRDYYIRRLVKPVSKHANGTLDVKIGLALIQLIDIDELNQVMTTNVWLYQEWQDHHLSFDPREYNGIEKMDVPAHMIWLPDIVLYNSADGLYAVPPCLRVRLRHDGTLQWDPPIIYRSFCQIDIQWFPFDRQNCSMKFGSWTYDGLTINLIHKDQKEFSGDVQFIDNEVAVDFENFRENTEWTVTAASAKRTVFTYSCCPTPYLDVTFYLVVTRKPLFIVINLLFPCFIISFLSVFVFYLPAQSGEKMSLSVSILVALIMFFLVVFEKIPATSLTLPLFAKFLIFTLVLVTLSIVLNVAIIRIHWMAIEYLTMPRWIRRLFLETLAPKFLDPDPDGPFMQSILASKRARENVEENFESPREPSLMRNRSPKLQRSPAFGHVPNQINLERLLISNDDKMPMVLTKFERELIDEFASHSNKIYDFIRKKNDNLASQEEWRVVALVVDKIFFCIFVIVFSTGSIWIFWQALFSTFFWPDD